VGTNERSWSEREVAKEGVRSRKKTTGLKNMKVHEQMGRYYQFTHIVVQPTV
jgi:hypothetical protein